MLRDELVLMRMFAVRQLPFRQWSRVTWRRSLNEMCRELGDCLLNSRFGLLYQYTTREKYHQPQ